MVEPTFRTYCEKIDGYCNGTKYQCRTCNMRQCPHGKGMVSCSCNEIGCSHCLNTAHPNSAKNTWGYNLFGQVAGQDY